MPRTSMRLLRNAEAAVEITALAAGAGPPAKRTATRRIAPEGSETIAGSREPAGDNADDMAAPVLIVIFFFQPMPMRSSFDGFEFRSRRLLLPCAVIFPSRVQSTRESWFTLIHSWFQSLRRHDLLAQH